GEGGGGPAADVLPADRSAVRARGGRAMTVQELRETLTRLVELLRAADAKVGTTNSLAEFVELTAGFDALTLKAFVKLAEVGRTPPTQKPPPAPKTRPVKPAADPGTVVAEVTALYERAEEPTVTEEQIRSACGRLDVLKKDILVRLSEGVG